MTSRHLFAARNVLAFLLTVSLVACTATVPTTEPTLIPERPTATNPPPATLPPAPTEPEPALDGSLTLIWQSEFSPDAALASPSDFVVDPEGNIYVTTQSPHNIKKFNSDGKLIEQWGSFGTKDGQFNLASGIALDRHGNVYVADFRNRRIQKFDGAGNFIRQWPIEPSAFPASLGIDQEGFIYVDLFSRADQPIHKFDRAGQLIKTWGSPGEGDGQFGYGATSGPEDVAIDSDGFIYIADRVNHRIQKFDSEGSFTAKFGGEDSTEGNGLFSDPRGIAVDTEGNLYVLDSYFLQKLDAEGNFIAQWPTTEGGDLDRAAIVGLDAENNIYVFAHITIQSATGDVADVWSLKKLRQN
jgi:DNA-binding beta-propeller fold protein YncE